MLNNYNSMIQLIMCSEYSWKMINNMSKQNGRKIQNNY